MFELFKDIFLKSLEILKVQCWFTQKMRVSTPLTWRQKKYVALLAAGTRNSTDVNLQEPTGMGFTI